MLIFFCTVANFLILRPELLYQQSVRLVDPREVLCGLAVSVTIFVISSIDPTVIEYLAVFSRQNCLT